MNSSKQQQQLEQSKNSSRTISLYHTIGQTPHVHPEPAHPLLAPLADGCRQLDLGLCPSVPPGLPVGLRRPRPDRRRVRLPPVQGHRGERVRGPRQGVLGGEAASGAHPHPKAEGRRGQRRRRLELAEVTLGVEPGFPRKIEKIECTRFEYQSIRGSGTQTGFSLILIWGN